MSERKKKATGVTLVNIIVPAYQAATHIEEALASLRAQRGVTFDITVVDDGSTDATAAIVTRLAEAPAPSDAPLRLITQDNLGAGAARDAGIAAGTAPFVLLADADDRADPDLLLHLTEALQETQADLAFARCRYIDAEGQVVAVQDPQKARPDVVDILEGFMVNSPLVRRSALAEIGGHDPALKGSIDLDLRVRLAQRRPGAVICVDKVLSDYRRSAGQITSDWRRMRDSWFQVRDKAVASGLVLTRAADRRMHGRHCVYWATLAYMAGEYTAARRLMVGAAVRVPGYVLRDPQARIRAAACLASLLPSSWHDRLRARFNAVPGSV